MSKEDEDMNKETELKKVFAEWKERQDKEENIKMTTVDGIQKETFIEDGFICYEKYSEAKKKILFILKESNTKDYVEGSHSQVGFYTNWINAGEGLNQGKQQLKMGLMAYILSESIKNEIVLSKEEAENVAKKYLEKAAFMNVNKRGGENQSDSSKLGNYVKYYRRNIEAEIDVIAPDVIVVLGDMPETVYQICTDRQIPFIRMWHTAFGMQKTVKETNEIAEDKNITAYVKEFQSRL